MRRFADRTLFALILALMSALLAPRAWACALDEQWETISDTWYKIEVAGSPAGWMHQMEEKSGDRYRTREETRMTIGRAGAATTVFVSSALLESADGTPIRMDYAQKMSAQTVETSWKFEADGIVESSKQGDRVSEKKLPALETDAITPHVATQRVIDAIHNDDKVVEFDLLDAASGLAPVHVRQERTGAETIDVQGKPTPVTIWNVKTSMVPATVVERIDSDGEMVSQNVDLGFGALSYTRCSREMAMKADTGVGPELLVATFVKLDSPLERVNRITHLELRLSMKDGSDMPELPTAGAQHVWMADDNKSSVLTISPAIKDAAEVVPGEMRGDAPEFLETSPMVNTDDPKVMELAERAGGDEADDVYERAEALRAFVHRFISKKGLDVAFAPASEIARDRKGDCSEHAVLLCALMRAQKIPARVAIGMVYADSFANQQGIFGWHMWTQAWIDGKWIDYDATLNTRFNAGHIMAGASSLHDGVNDAQFASLVLLIGKLDVKVMRGEYAESDASSSSQ